MEAINIEEVLCAANRKDLTETGGGHNQKGVDFQRTWALARMFELEGAGAQDFLFLFETIQDIAELDSYTAPSNIRIYQVKKKDRGEWKWNELTRLVKPSKNKTISQPISSIKDSPIGKLYSSVLAFRHLKSTGHFLSNTGCDLPLNNGGNTATSLPCNLSHLDAQHLDLLIKGLEYLHQAVSLPANPSLIYVEKVPLHPDGLGKYLQGIAVEFLSQRSRKHAGQARALVDALLAKIGPLGSKTDSCATFEQLRKERGYSRNEFLTALAALEDVPDLVDLLESWLDQLAWEGSINIMERTSIHLAAGRIFKVQVMCGEDPLAGALVADCDKWLASNALGTNLSEFLNKAKAELAPLHPSFRLADFSAHFMLRAIKKCGDQT